MHFPAPIAVGAAALVGLGLWIALRRGRWLALPAAGLVLVTLTRLPVEGDPHAVHRPADATARPDATHAGSAACRACHPGEYATWHHSYHRTMTTAPSAQTVRAPWTGELRREGRVWRLRREGDRFQVDAPAYGTDGAGDRRVAPVVMVTGSHHMQAYWLPAPQAPARDPAAAEAFKGRCVPCHGTEGRGADVEVMVATAGPPVPVTPPALALAECPPPRVRATLAAPVHREAVEGLDAAGREALAGYVDGLQIHGRLMQFPWVWLIDKRRWAHEEDTFLQPPPAAQDAEPYSEAWSDGCDQCHSVAPSFTWDDATRRGQAAVAELGIACEACHGPGRAHVDRHRSPLARSLPAPADDIVNPADLSPRAAAGVCAQCHAELVPKADPLVIGQPVEAAFHVVQRPAEGEAMAPWLAAAVEGDPALLEDGFWPDGTIRVAGRDYNGLARTGCFTRGELTCITCHSLHGYTDRSDQLGPGQGGDGACTGCHPQQVGPGHTHHAAGSEGSRCMNCHMPYTTFGLLGLIRAHRIDAPDPAAAVATGRPDACSLCHLDRRSGELAAQVAAWWPRPVRAVPTEDPQGPAAAVQWLLRGDAVQRATAAWHMGWAPARQASGDGWQAPLLARLLDDPYPAVRAVAFDALRRLPGYGDFAYDYTGDPAERALAVGRALARWTPAAPGDACRLQGADGAVDAAALRALQAQRDDRPVGISE